MGGPPTKYLSPYRPITQQRTAASLRSLNRGRVWLPGQHAETPIHYTSVRPVTDRTAATLRNRLRGDIWLPGGQSVHQPETPWPHPWKTIVGQHPPRAGRIWMPRNVGETPDLRPWSILQVVGRHPPRAGRASVAPVHLPETPIVHPWAVLQVVGRHPPRAGWAHVAPVHLPETPIVHPWSVQRVFGRRWTRPGLVWQPRGLAPPTGAAPTAIHQWTILAGQHPWRAGRAAVPRVHLPETPWPHPWKAIVGQSARGGPRAGRVWLPAQHFETPIVHPWAVQRLAGGQVRRAGRAILPSSHLPETPVVRPWATLEVLGRRWQQRGRLWLPRPIAPTAAAPAFLLPGWHIVRGIARPAPRGRVWLEPLPRPPVIPSVLRPLFVARRGEDRARRQRGFIVRWTNTTFGSQPAVGYNIYANTGIGDPINYLVPIATVHTLSYTTNSLSYPGYWKIAVRAFNAYGEEKNLDCEIDLILDGSGNDITGRPLPPVGLRAFATAGGGIRVEWAYPGINRAKLPTGFHVYKGTGGTPNYGSPAATISYSSGIAKNFVANLAGLTNGTAYTIGVRAYNAVAEEPNTSTVTVTASSVGPAAVDGFSGIATVGD
jgi:hypothetical protein